MVASAFKIHHPVLPACRQASESLRSLPIAIGTPLLPAVGKPGQACQPKVGGELFNFLISQHLKL